jgi:hypothetical protein
MYSVNTLRADIGCEDSCSAYSGSSHSLRLIRPLAEHICFLVLKCQTVCRVVHMPYYSIEQAHCEIYEGVRI